MNVFNPRTYWRRFWGFLFFALAACQPSVIFAAIPIQDSTVQGAAAANARLKVLAAAESFLGTPYRYAGLDRRGLDCSGLIYLSFRESLNITVPRTSAGLYNWAEKINTSELVPGDLVFFVTAGTAVSHVGIYAGDGRFIHAASDGPRTGVMYSRLDESYWSRTYKGAGRALPWSSAAAQAMANAQTGEISPVAQSNPPEQPVLIAQPAPTSCAAPTPSSSTWKNNGFFIGFGAAWTWGVFVENSPFAFRGISTMATAGYKWSKYRVGLELGPEWDGALGTLSFPFTLSAGTDIFQVFAGPSYVYADSRFSLADQGQNLPDGGTWLWDVGLSAAFPPIQFCRGAFSLYGELVWQLYDYDTQKNSQFRDIMAAMRFSTGLRYLWMIK